MNARRVVSVLLMSIVAFTLLTAESCDSQDRRDAEATSAKMEEMRSQVGLPNIVNFTEAKFAREIAEMRDSAIRTWTYYVDLNGGRHLLCESVGFGLPYSVQLTNPERIMHGLNLTLPQAEPNGLFMPTSADATWIMCSDGAGHVAPVYAEPRIIVSPFPLGHVDAANGSGFDDKVVIQKLDAKSINVQTANTK